MTYALSSGITGMLANQKMMDVAGNNLANLNTTAFKASRVTFEELLGQTIDQGSRPLDGLGGTNPQQVGCGVDTSGITPNTTQGSIVNTGNPLDVAIEGNGYFVVSDGEEYNYLYTRAGAFGVDSAGYLVDPSNGYRVQRIGLTGEADGFQVPGDGDIRVPYDVALPATATTEIVITGNISSDATNVSQAQVLTSSLQYTSQGGREPTVATELDQLDQFSGGSEPDGQLGAAETGTITISGYNPDGSAISTGLSFAVAATTTLGDLITHLNTNVLNGATASLWDGRIRITDDVAGYSKSDISLSYTGAGLLEAPPYFEMTTVGGEEVKGVNIAMFDSQGGKHVLSAALVRTDTVNTWDMVLTSVSGNVESISPDNRRINNLTFSPQTGAYSGLPVGELPEFTVTFDHDVLNPQTIALNFGTVGAFDGLTQFAGTSTAVAREQDGYEAGHLTSVWVNGDGVLTGAFSNGIKKDIAALQLSLFANPAGLMNVGGGYFSTSVNSGDAVAVQASHAGAGTVHGGALEKSNADVATEFVTLIQAQNGYQANARTIRVATDILRELTSLIR